MKFVTSDGRGDQWPPEAGGATIEMAVLLRYRDGRPEVVSLEETQQICDQENEQHGPEADAGAAAVTPAAVAIVSATAT